MEADPLKGWKMMMLLLQGFACMMVFRFLHALLSPKKEEGISAASLVQIGPLGTSGFGALNPNGSLLERFDYWFVKNLQVDVALDQLHMQLGRPAKPQPIDILHQKQVAVLILAGFLFIILGWRAVPLAVVAFFIPDALLRGQVERRQQEILGTFPQFVDLTALMLESGADYMTAFDKICRVSRKRTDLELEIEKTIAEVSLGTSRKDALRHLADRVGVQELRSFVGLIIQSEELGTSLVGLLRDFGTDMRFRRLNKAEKLAAQAATKMLIPLFVFIFPTVFILMLAPMVKELIFGGGLF